MFRLIPLLSRALATRSQLAPIAAVVVAVVYIGDAVDFALKLEAVVVARIAAAGQEDDIEAEIIQVAVVPAA